MSFEPELIPYTKQDLKEIGTNFLNYIIKETDDNNLKEMCKQELIERGTTTFFDGTKHIKL